MTTNIAYVEYAKTLSLLYGSKADTPISPYAAPALVGTTPTLTTGWNWDEVATGGSRGGDARSLNGTSQAYQIPAATMNSAISGGSFSFVVWLKRNTGGTPAALEAMGSGTIGSNIIILSPSMSNIFGLDTLRCRVIFFGSSQSPSLQFLHDGFANDGQWRMLGFTFAATGGVAGAGGTLSLIYDGRIQSSVSCTAAQVPTALANNFGIGAYFNPSGGFWMPWTFDYFTLHGKALSQSEVVNLYRAMNGHVDYSGGVLVNKPTENAEVLRSISCSAKTTNIAAFTVGDSQAIRNVGGVAGPPARNTDQGFAHYDARLLRYLDRGRFLKGLIMSPQGPDPSNAFINGGCCWQTGSVGSASPPSHILSRSAITDNDASASANGTRIGVYYNASPDAAITGTLGDWRYAQTETGGRAKLPYSFIPRARIQVFRMTGGGESKPAMYRTSDGTILAGGTTQSHSGADDYITLTLLANQQVSTEFGVSIHRDGSGVGTTTRPTAFGFCIIDNPAQESGVYHGCLWSRGGYDLNELLKRLASGGTAARNRFTQAMRDILDAVNPDTATRDIVLWLHTGSNIINGTYASDLSYNPDFTTNAALARTGAGYKRDVQTFLSMIQSGLSGQYRKLYCVLGPYQGNNSGDLQLLRRAERELAADNPDICMIYGDIMYSAQDILDRDGGADDMTFDASHLNFNGFNNYASSTETLVAGLVEALGGRAMRGRDWRIR